ncbi:MAG: hypothetical protein RL161_1170, partial [Bacteroidota bacterium]
LNGVSKASAIGHFIEIGRVKGEECKKG